MVIDMKEIIKIISKKSLLITSKMFPQLPEELERMIWRWYFSIEVCPDVKAKDSIWVNPSGILFYNTSDPGAIQIGYTDLERRYDCPYIEPHCVVLRWILGYHFLDIICEDCWYNKWGDCQQEKDDIEFQKRANIWWDLD